MDEAGNDRICANCIYWQPNGGALGMGYCVKNGFGYRKPSQHCEKFDAGHLYVFRVWANERETLIGVKAKTMESASKFVHDKFGERSKFEFRYY